VSFFLSLFFEPVVHVTKLLFTSPTLARVSAGNNIYFAEVRSTFVVHRTWSGPGWTPAQSLSSVLVSIQSLMNEKPYHNEPGFSKVQVFELS